MKHLIAKLLMLCPFFLYVGSTVEKVPPIDRRDGYADPHAMIEEGRSLLKDGDLVVRLNRAPASRFIRYFNRHDKSYSHSGIVLYEHGYPYIFHVVDGAENPDGKLRADSLGRFCDPRKNMAYGIFRYDMSAGEIENLRKWVHHWYAKGIRFDPNFDLASDDRMYCSEMVSKAVARATDNRILIGTTELTNTEAIFFAAYTRLPLAYTSKLKIVSIDDLYNNPFCRRIRGYDYDNNR